MVKRILVGLSGTTFTPAAVEHAIELAAAHEAEVTGVTIVDMDRLEDVGPVPLGGGAAAHALAAHRVHVTEERVREVIAGFEDSCRARKVTHRVVHEQEDAMKALRDLWRYHDLTVLGLRGLFEYGVVENPKDAVIDLIAHGVRPILAVTEQVRPIRKVLIAYNGSMTSAKSMKLFMLMRLWPEIDVRIVSFDEDADRAAPLLAEAAGYCKAHGYDAETECAGEGATQHLLPYATEWGADLLVMGTRHHSRLRKLFLGDTAHEAIENAGIPLFLAR